MKIGVIGLGTLGEYYVRDFKKFKTKIVASKNSRLSSTLKKNNLIKKKSNSIKVLGNGELKDKIKIETNLISKSAKDKIEKIGGSIVQKK